MRCLLAVACLQFSLKRLLFMSRPLPVPAAIDHDESETAVSPARDLSWNERREFFRSRLELRPLANISSEEVEVHFSTMPRHYWERISESDLVWGLETIHGFLKLVASPQVPATAPFVSWRHSTASPCTRVMLCSWDRHGLLAKAAAAFSAVRLNILQADIFTRADSIVLDEFSITDAQGSTASDSQLQDMTFLLEGALTEPPRFASVWACSRHKFLASPSLMSPRIVCDSDTSHSSTIVQIEAADRLGLLYDILQAIVDAGLNIKQARIETEGQVARDIIHVTDEQGQKLLDRGRLELLCAKLEAALTVND
jgi:UTP:GlnB (protein PII) uridylyltransferase